MKGLTTRLKTYLVPVLLMSLFVVFSTEANGQQEDERYIKTTKKGIKYEIIGWESDVVYNPYSFTWFAWEEPIVKKETVESVAMVPVSEFDRPPVFDGICLTKKDQFACTNNKLQEYIETHFVDYPDKAQYRDEEGLEYVTFTLNEEGNFEGNLKVVSRDKPCTGCAEAAVELVSEMEDKWFPAIKDGKTVKTQLTIPVRFELFE